MAAGVSSGLGRNGPWLQNRWIRLDSRVDDGSLSPIALDGGFRPAERALAYALTSDGRRIDGGRSEYDVRPQDDALGAGRRLRLTSRDARGLALIREAALYEAWPQCVVRCGVRNDGPEPVAVASLHPFAVPGHGRLKLRLDAAPADWRVYRHGWQSWSPTMSLGGGQPDLRSAPPLLSPETPEAEPGRFASEDVGVLHDPAGGRSLLIGAATARDLLTRVELDVPQRAADVRCLADGIAVAPGDTMWSERIAVDLCGTPQEQLERYGDALGRLMQARVPARAPFGWCSWYYFYTGVTEEDVVRNLRFLEKHRDALPVDTVQIDDGYQADIGDWLTANEKFPHGMRWLADEIRGAGFTPGLWLAPFLLSERSRTYAEHPGWVVRQEDGDPALAIHNWQRRNFALDGTHPDAIDWLRQVIGTIVDEWGYDYLKIDFLYAAAIAGLRRDPQATRVQAYRRALAAVRERAGERFVLGCGALIAPSAGVFDGNRVGPDVAPFWRFLTTGERDRRTPRPRAPDDQLSAETSIRNTLNRWWMHGRLWANDPDCVLVREDRTKLSLDEVRALATAIGLSGGMVLSSDDLERLTPQRLDILSAMLPPLPRAGVPADVMERDMPERVELPIDRAFDPLRVVGLFNFSDEARDLVLPLPPGRWRAFEFWEERYLGEREGEVVFGLVPAHGCRLVALRPGGGPPSLAGTTGHLGMGTLDISSVGWDEASGTLAVAVEPAGRRRRRLAFDAAGRRLASASLDGRDVPAKAAGRAVWVDVECTGPATLEVTFG